MVFFDIDWLYEYYGSVVKIVDGDDGLFVMGSFVFVVYFLEVGLYVCLLYMDEFDIEK